jgi:hypothetical protein
VGDSVGTAVGGAGVGGTGVGAGVGTGVGGTGVGGTGVGAGVGTGVGGTGVGGTGVGAGVGHACVLHCCVEGPSQSAPPHDGEGLVQLRVCEPGPQVVEQALHAVQPPSTRLEVHASKHACLVYGPPGEITQWPQLLHSTPQVNWHMLNTWPPPCTSLHCWETESHV